MLPVSSWDKQMCSHLSCERRGDRWQQAATEAAQAVEAAEKQEKAAAEAAQAAAAASFAAEAQADKLTGAVKQLQVHWDLLCKQSAICLFLLTVYISHQQQVQ